ncbi:hypothetical protein Tco_0549566 [Tanacetum coccineum]
MFRLNIVNDNIASAFMSNSKLNIQAYGMLDRPCPTNKGCKYPKNDESTLFDIDLCDLLATPSVGNNKYFVTFIDDASRAVVRLPDPKLKTLGERGIECIFVGNAEHLKAFKFYVTELNESVSINLIIESRDAIFDENRFSSVPRPSLRIPNGTEDIGGSMALEEVTEEVVTQQSEPRTRKGKKNRTPKNFGPEFQLYLIEGTKDEVSKQHSYCFNVEDDPKIFDEAIKSQDVEGGDVAEKSALGLWVYGGWVGRIWCRGRGWDVYSSSLNASEWKEERSDERRSKLEKKEKHGTRKARGHRKEKIESYRKEWVTGESAMMKRHKWDEGKAECEKKGGVKRRAGRQRRQQDGEGKAGEGGSTSRNKSENGRRDGDGKGQKERSVRKKEKLSAEEHDKRRSKTRKDDIAGVKGSGQRVPLRTVTNAYFLDLAFAQSLNVIFDESPPPTKLSPLVDDDVGEEEAIKRNTKVVN